MNNLAILIKNKKLLTIHTKGGLGNKLRVLLSYLYDTNNNKYPNKKLRIIWDKSDECPDIFSNLFEPIPDVLIKYGNIDNYFINIYTSHPSNDDYITNNYLKLLKPLPHIQTNIDNLKKLLQKSNPNYIACHIRRTDMIKKYKEKKITNYLSDQEYMHFINQYPVNIKVYIATDNYETQQTFINFYGDRLIYKKIEPSTNLRQTSLQDAVVDMYVCAGAKYFLGSVKSSFSDTITYLQLTN